MIHAVIFDMDGVLIDTEKYLMKYWCQSAREHGFDMKKEHALCIRSLAGKFAEPKLKEFFGKDFDYKLIRERRKELMSNHIREHGLEKKRDVDEILDYLKENGYKIAVATATDFERAKQYLEQIGIYDKFDKIICAPMVENGKPMPDIYLYACEQIGENPENCIAVEDSPNGVLSASRAGLKTIMVPDLTKPDEETKERLYREIERLGDLIPILAEQRKNELKEQIVAYRFQPIQDELFDLLRKYEDICNKQNDEDGLAFACFYRGEAFFRLGKFDPCITYLNYSLLHQKKEENRHLEPSAYNVLGLMFSLLGYEVVALEYYLKSLDLAEEYGLYNQKAITYINMGWLYRDLDDLLHSMECYELGLQELQRSKTNNYYNIAVLCHAYRGQLFCKLGQYDKGMECACIIESLKKENPTLFYDVAVQDLYVRLYDYLGDEEKVHENLDLLIEKSENSDDFLEFCEFYINVCHYTLEKGMKKETRVLLNHLHKNIDQTELNYIKLKIQELEVAYQNEYSHYEAYLNACREYMVMQEKYEYYIKKTKLTGMKNMQSLRKTKKEKEKYKEISRRDKMTGLLNKSTLEDSVRYYLKNHHNYDDCPALILIDLDHFKLVNDTWGHLTGDHLICDVADKIKKLFPYTEIIGRVGGDEFVIFFSEAYARKDCIERAEELRRELNKLTYCEKKEVKASMGIAFVEEEIDSYETLFAIADKALYEAKKLGRNKIVIGN